jgi:hypothetical protein
LDVERAFRDAFFILDRNTICGYGIFLPNYTDLSEAELIAADIVLAGAHGLAGLALGVSLWGLHMGLSQGLLAAVVADEAPADRRGTAFGLFNLATGVLLLGASILAGGLWDHLGPPATFYAGANFAGSTAGGPQSRKDKK